jgi:hypothetical protein
MPVINPFYPPIDHPRFRYWKSEPLWDEKQTKHTYQDGDASFNELSDYPGHEWELVYEFQKQNAGHWDNLAIFDAHFRDRRKSRVFTFQEKDGTVVTNCYYKSYTPSHEGNESQFQTRTIVLVCYRYNPSTVPGGGGEEDDLLLDDDGIALFDDGDSIELFDDEL